MTEAEHLSDGVCFMMRERHQRQSVRSYLYRRYGVLLRTMPATKLPLEEIYYDRDGAAFAYKPKAGAKTPQAHESGNAARGQRREQLPRTAYHAAFWIMAMLHEKLTEQYARHKGVEPTGGVHALAVHRKNFAQHYTAAFANLKFHDFVGLSASYTRVVEMDALIQGLQRFMRAIIERNKHKDIFQFKGLNAEHVDVEYITVQTVHTAKESLPKFAMLILLGK